MGPTAKLDITSQAYDVLDQHMPELTKAMRDEVEGKAQVAEYFWADYVPLPVEVSGRHLTHEERVKYAQFQPQDLQEKAWKDARQKADAIVDVIHGSVVARYPDAVENDFVYSIRLQEAIKHEMEERRDMIKEDDKDLIPTLVTAIRAHRNTDRIWQQQTDEIFGLLFKNVDVNSAYKKQKLHDKNSSDGGSQVR